MEHNVTYLTIGGYVEISKYRFLYFFMLLLVYIIIICCNITIVLLIWKHQHLHEPMYIFIAALLCNSVLFSTVIYPKMLVDVLSEKQIIAYSTCIFQCFLNYCLFGSEFLLLALMAYDRYVSICKPLQYHTIMRRSMVKVSLVLAWLLPSAQVAVPNILAADMKLCHFRLKGIFCNNSILKLHCVKSTIISIYGAIVLINVTILPVCFIGFTYTKIFVITHRSGKDVRKKAAETCFPHLLVLMSFSCLVTYEVITVKLDVDFPKTVQLIMTIQVVLYHPLFNPIIYGLKMKEISKCLKKLFCKETD